METQGQVALYDSPRRASLKGTPRRLEYIWSSDLKGKLPVLLRALKWQPLLNTFAMMLAMGGPLAWHSEHIKKKGLRQVRETNKTFD